MRQSLAEQKPRNFDLVAEVIRLRDRVRRLETNKTGYSITGVIHLGEPEPEDRPTGGPGAGLGGFLYVESGALKWISTTNTSHQIGQP